MRKFDRGDSQGPVILIDTSAWIEWIPKAPGDPQGMSIRDSLAKLIKADSRKRNKGGGRMLVAKISTWLIVLFLIGIAASFILPMINFEAMLWTIFLGWLGFGIVRAILSLLARFKGNYVYHYTSLSSSTRLSNRVPNSLKFSKWLSPE